MQPENSQGVAAIAGCEHGKTGVLEDSARQVAHTRFVVDDQDGSSAGHGADGGGGFGGERIGALGGGKQKAESGTEAGLA